LTERLTDPHNPTNDWQGPFRVGWFDLSLARYALRVAGRVDALAVTWLDRWADLADARVASGYRIGDRAYRLPVGARELRADSRPVQFVHDRPQTMGLTKPSARLDRFIAFDDGD